MQYFTIGEIVDYVSFGRSDGALDMLLLIVCYSKIDSFGAFLIGRRNSISVNLGKLTWVDFCNNDTTSVD